MSLIPSGLQGLGLGNLSAVNQESGFKANELPHKVRQESVTWYGVVLSALRLHASSLGHRQLVEWIRSVRAFEGSRWWNRRIQIVSNVSLLIAKLQAKLQAAMWTSGWAQLLWVFWYLCRNEYIWYRLYFYKLRALDPEIKSVAIFLSICEVDYRLLTTLAGNSVSETH
jgi:hypothetical protein